MNNKAYLAINNLLLTADYSHSKRVQEKSVRFGELLGLSKNELDILSTSAKYHDVGKTFISPGILNKPGKLSGEEREIINQHPICSEDIIRSLNLPGKDLICEIVRHHHENYNGTGYPDNLSADKIPYLSKIIFIVDTFDALVSIRPYRASAFSIDDALDIMIDDSGIKFDPVLLEIFFNNIDEITEDKFIRKII